MLKTFKLWLEKDEEIPRLRRLQFKKVEIALADVLTKGIHPWQGNHIEANLGDKFLEILNSEKVKPAELGQFNYCEDVSDLRGCYYTNQSAFEELLSKVRQNVYFIESLRFAELLALAKERLQERWSHKVAYSVLSRVHPGFDETRTFLKSKDKEIKLSGYSDIDLYDLGRILSLKDFEGEDSVLISQGMPQTNFRSARFLEQVTDQRGLLRLADSIRDFQIQAKKSESIYADSVVYNCQHDGSCVTFRPELDRNESQRAWAKEVASRWRTDQGRYCFTTSIARVSEMIQDRRFVIIFPTLDYVHEREGRVSLAQMAHKRATLYRVGRYVTNLSSGYQVREVLRARRVSMGGRKEELFEKLAQLSVKVYHDQEQALEDYFGRHRFVRVAGASQNYDKPFPLLEGLDLGHMVLAMYILKHLRGNAVLDARHNNDTFGLLDLARSLINQEVSIEGSFMPVE
jgi:hypothetical protein